MKRATGYIAMLLGAYLLLTGLIISPPFLRLMPLELPFGNKGHTYLRFVPTTPEPPAYLWLAVVALGVLIITAGRRISRRPAA